MQRMADIQRGALFLRRLIGDSGVVLQTPELGPCVPISHDFDFGARFFKPWSRIRKIGMAPGGFSIEVPLSQIVAEGCASQVLAALGAAPSWMLRSLTWPHSTLALLATGDESGAKAHLIGNRRWMLSETADWEAAGVYWATFFEDRTMARHCFEKASGGHSRNYYKNRDSLAWNWLKLCGDADAALQCLYTDMDSGPTAGTTDEFAWYPLIAHADAWMTLFNRKDWATRYLEYASMAAGAPSAGGVFSTAMAWMCILGDEERAMDLAKRGMKNQDEFYPRAALYWYCIANDQKKARQCLWSKKWSKYQSEGFRIGLAESIVMFKGFDRDEDCLRHAKALIAEVMAEKLTEIDTRCMAAEIWSTMVGQGAEDMLTTAAAQAGESCELFEVARAWRQMVHLTAETRLSGARTVLERAEEIANNAVDYYFCAHAWKTIVGDDQGTERSLIKGEDCANDVQDIATLAKGWTEFLGQPSETRRMVLEKSAPILIKENQ